MEYLKFKVCCRCFTFNQAEYITDAMNGFTMQQTSFPFVCCIVDDASTDGEQEVIRKYVEEHFDLSEDSVAFQKETDYAYITYAQHKTNKNCYFAVLYLKENHYSQRKDKIQYLEEWRGMCEYEALCEGDDYWLVPYKLEEQVKFLDINPNVSLCFTNAEVICDIKGKEHAYNNLYCHLKDKQYSGEEILKQWSVPTASVVYRNGIKVPKDNRFIHGDIVLFMAASQYGLLYCINKKMVCYRRNINGVSMQKPNVDRTLAHYDAILEIFGTDYKNVIKRLKAKCLSACYLSCRFDSNSWKIYNLAYKEHLLLQFIVNVISDIYLYINKKLFP